MRLLRRRAASPASGPIVRLGPRLVQVETDLTDPTTGAPLVTWEPDAGLEVTCAQHGLLASDVDSEDAKRSLAEIARDHAEGEHAGHVENRGWMR